MKIQIELEDIFISLASNCGQQSLILCDRGVMDGKAYINESTWQALLDEIGCSVVHLRDRRYDQIIHMVTAANGAEQYYDTETNEARYETVQQAIDIDQKTQKAWTGHPNFSIVDNNIESFEDKTLKAITIVCDNLNLQLPQKNQIKFLLHNSEDAMIPTIPGSIHVQKLEMLETFLLSQDEGALTSRLIKRGHDHSYTYIIATKKKCGNEFQIKKKHISSAEYFAFMIQKDSTRRTISRIRQCFLYKQAYFMLDTYKNVNKGVSVLRVELDKDQNIQPPDFLAVDRDITDDSKFSTRVLAQKDWVKTEE